MTETDRARLERARAHPAYNEAMGREPADYTVPVLLMGLFYLLVPMIIFVPLALIVSTSGGHPAQFVVMGSIYAIYSIPFWVVFFRTRRLRDLPAQRVFGLSGGPAARQPGKWLTVEPAEGEPTALRLRLRAYIDSTGGAMAPGKIGVAMCRGDQMVEWVPIPEVAA